MDSLDRAAEGPQTSPVLSAQQTDLSARLLTELQALPGGEQRAIAMCILAGLSHAEAATAVGVRKNTMKSRVRRGLDRLKKKFGNVERWREAFLSAPVFLFPDGSIEEASARWSSTAKSTKAMSQNGSVIRSRVWLAGTAAVIGTVIIVAWLAAGRSGDDGSGHESGGREAPAEVSIGGDATAADKPRALTPTREAGTGVNDSARKNPTAVGARVTPGPSTNTPAESKWGPDSRPLIKDYSDGTRAARGTEVRIDDRWVAHGPCTTFYRSGSEEEDVNYTYGKRDGACRRYFDRAKDEKAQFVGPAKQLKATGAYDKNLETGTWFYFDRDGRVAMAGNRAAGKQEGVWLRYHPNGSVRWRGNYTDGQIDGLVTTYDDSERRMVETHYIRGDKSGVEFTFDPDSQYPLMRTEWKANKKDGTETEYHRSTHRTVRQTEYELGEQHGYETHFGPDGAVTSRVLFQRGKPAANEAPGSAD